MKDDKRIEPTTTAKALLNSVPVKRNAQPMTVRVWKAMTKIKNSLGQELWKKTKKNKPYGI